jgi:hypothetical protein
MVINRVFHYFIGFLVRPARASVEMAEDPRGVWAGFWWAMLFYLAYAVTVLIYFLLGHEPVSRPFLPIPLDRWYLVQTFTTIPVGLAGAMTYTGLVYLMCKAAGGRGSYEATFGSQMYTTIVPWIFCTLLPELFLAPFLIAAGHTAMLWPDWIEMMRQFVVPVLWVLILSTIALGRVHLLRWWKVLPLCLVALIPMAGIMAVFIR